MDWNLFIFGIWKRFIERDLCWRESGIRKLRLTRYFIHYNKNKNFVDEDWGLFIVYLIFPSIVTLCFMSLPMHGGMFHDFFIQACSSDCKPRSCLIANIIWAISPFKNMDFFFLLSHDSFGWRVFSLILWVVDSHWWLITLLSLSGDFRRVTL